MTTRTLQSTLAVLAIGLTALFASTTGRAAEALMEYVPGAQITEVRLADNVVVIDGLTYRVPLDARIEVHGSYGAFTMLEAGMKVEYVFNRYSETRRDVVALRHLPEDAPVLKH